MNQRILVFFVCLTASFAVWGFVPPLGILLHDAFESRKPVANIELILRHRIQTDANDAFELEERILSSHAQTLITWRSSDSSYPYEASLDRAGYRANDRRMPLHSSLFLKYLLLSSAEAYRDALLAEQFIYRDELLQYKEGFNPTGAPETWDLKNNYLIHPDMYLTRLSDSVGVAVTGLDSGTSRRTIVFNRNEPGVRRLEWRDGNEVSAWNFDQIGKLSSGGWFPREMSFIQGDKALVQTELVSRRVLSAREASNASHAWAKGFSSGRLSARADEALRVLLSYR